MAGTYSNRPQSTYISNNPTFSCNVVTFFCFLGVLSASLVAICMDPRVLFKVYGIAFKHDENCARATRDPFLLRCVIHWGYELLTGRWLASHGILSRYSNTWAQHNSNRRWKQNYYSSIVYSTVYFMQLWFNTASLHLFTFLSSANGTMHDLWVCV